MSNGRKGSKMNDFSLIPTTPEVVYTLLGAVAICTLLTQWLKKYLPDWRWTSLVALGSTIVVVEAAGALILAAMAATALMILRQLFIGLLLGFAGATIETFGYEAITNALGLAGLGSRSNAALLAAAERLVESDATTLNQIVLKYGAPALNRKKPIST